MIVGRESASCRPSEQRSGALLNQFGAAQKTTLATKKLLATIVGGSNMAFWRSAFLGGCPDRVHRKKGFGDSRVD
jgi:hypothetical protein